MAHFCSICHLMVLRPQAKRISNNVSVMNVLLYSNTVSCIWREKEKRCSVNLFINCFVFYFQCKELEHPNDIWSKGRQRDTDSSKWKASVYQSFHTGYMFIKYHLFTSHSVMYSSFGQVHWFIILDIKRGTQLVSVTCSINIWYYT